MTRWTAAPVAALVACCGVVLAADPPPPPQVFEGKLVPYTRLDDKALPAPVAAGDGLGVALVAADGKAHALAGPGAKGVILDKQLHDRPVRLFARVRPGTQALEVEKLQTVKDGRAYHVDYWCEKCQLAASEPGKCKCCGADVELRELPVKTPVKK
ncbi:MAG: hypothetical protein U0804_09895 [Gemmataceae bacterium]